MSRQLEAKEDLQSNPAQFIREALVQWARSDPSNKLSFLNDYHMYDDPMVEFADGDDPIFDEYKGIIGSAHLTPREAIAQAYNKRPEDMPERLSVICYIWPVAEETRIAHRKEKLIPGRLWSHTRWYGKHANMELHAYLVKLLIDMGHLAAAPVLQPYFQFYNNEKGPYSNWSDRHLAFAAGLGTFGLSDAFITERGVAHNCGAVVTSLSLPATPRTAKNPYANCLFYQGVECKACMKRCPSGAITEKGHDKIKCEQNLNKYGEAELSKISRGEGEYDNDNSIGGCGLCMVGVPCEFQNPTKKIKEKT